MPLIHVKLVEGLFTAKHKQDIIHKLNDTMMSVKRANRHPVTWVVIEEVKCGDRGESDNPHGAPGVKAMAARISRR